MKGTKFALGSVLAMLLAVPFSAEAAGLAEDRARADAHLEDGDYRKAFKAYRSLARDGDHDAQYLVAEMYASGTGTDHDLNDAYAWAVLAGESGLDKLKVYADELLARAEDPDKARSQAVKLRNKYGKEALQAKADRLSVRGAGRQYGSCTGSRIACNNVNAVRLNGVGGAGAPPADPAGGN